MRETKKQISDKKKRTLVKNDIATAIPPKAIMNKLIASTRNKIAHNRIISVSPGYFILRHRD